MPSQLLNLLQPCFLVLAIVSRGGGGGGGVRNIKGFHCCFQGECLGEGSDL